MIASGPRLFDQLKRKQVAKGLRIARSMLASVGGISTAFTTDPALSAIHIQKPLLPAEISALPVGWMELTAIDELGPCKLLNIDDEPTG